MQQPDTLLKSDWDSIGFESRKTLCARPHTGAVTGASFQKRCRTVATIAISHADLSMNTSFAHSHGASTHEKTVVHQCADARCFCTRRAHNSFLTMRSIVTRRGGHHASEERRISSPSA